jgi:hypothetical protein
MAIPAAMRMYCGIRLRRTEYGAIEREIADTLNWRAG